MTNPVDNPAAAEPYEAFIASALGKVRTELDKARAAAAETDPEAPEKTFTDVEVLALVEFSLHTTRYLFNGPPIETMLRNAVTKATATRLVNARGVPVWNVTPKDGGKGYEVEESILTPEDDWKCVYNPAAEGADSEATP